MKIPYIKGKVTKQAHVDIPSGLHEEEYGRNGFFGGYAHFYRTEPPVGWTRIEGDLRPQAFDFSELGFLGSETSCFSKRRSCLYNSDVKMSFLRTSGSMAEFFRNADADEIYFVHEGGGILESEFGPVGYRKGDYLVVPRGIAYRFHADAESKFIVFESYSEPGFPEKGMLGEHALIDPAVIEVPEPEGLAAFRDKDQRNEYEVQVLRGGKITKIYYPFYPLNSVGWKGTATVMRFNVSDIRPISSERYHLPPSAHSTFVANNFVICTFLPRPLETGDPGALKVPYYHSNIDFDEVLFYHEGEFFSRTGIKPGMMTFHPQGIHHGPQKEAIERSKDAERTNEVAVMLDTKRPLFVAEELNDFEWKDYWKSWQE